MPPDSPPSVLVLEDDLLTSSALRQLLISDGYDPVLTFSVREAMKTLSGQPFAILDLLLPDGSGLEVLHEIREKFPATRVLISSGHCDVDTERELERLGVSLHPKPISVAKILEWLKKSPPQA